MKLMAFTDGACAGNPGPGGWGAILRAYDDVTGQVLKEREICGYEIHTTNNQMEMMAAIHALEALHHPSVITIRSDSKYLIDGATKWIRSWKARKWKLRSGAPVKNIDLWKRIDAQQQRHSVMWKWVKGHSGHKMNERADALAVEQRKIASKLKREEDNLLEDEGVILQ